MHTHPPDVTETSYMRQQETQTGGRSGPRAILPARDGPGTSPGIPSQNPGKNASRPRMRAFTKTSHLCVLGILLAAMLAAPVFAFQTTESIEAATKVYVSNVSYNPGSFYPGDEGTVTVKVTNGNTDQGVVVNHATLYDNTNKFVVTSPSFSSSTNIGPGQTQTFAFTIKADSMGEGTFYPIFSMSFRDADSLWHRTTVRIEDAPLELTITSRPDVFTSGVKTSVKVMVWNPRESSVRSVTIVPSGTGITTTPVKAYVGDLAPGASREVTFEVTPTQETELTFTADYLNGVNEHASVVKIPVSFGTDKKGARIVVNNIESSQAGSSVTLKGDVTNNGLTDAKSVLVTVASPATPVNPNPVYAIGNLEPDDFSSFEVTCTASGPGAIPLLVEYKDIDGNVFEETFSINADGNTAAAGSAAVPGGAAGTASAPSNNRRGAFGSFGSGFGMIPVTEIVTGLVLIIALAIAWKKGLLRRLADKFRKKPVTDNRPVPEP